jgi:hypothetical protein
MERQFLSHNGEKLPLKAGMAVTVNIQIRDRSRQPIGVAQVDPAARPMLVRAIAADGAPHEIYLDWEHALDDAGQLRSCVTCGCQHLYRRRTLPRFAPFALLLAGAGVVAGVLGYSSDPIVLAALVALLVLDGAVLVLARVQLVCYRCGSAYGGRGSIGELQEIGEECALRLTGLLLGQTLHTTAHEIYRAYIEATAFGALTIIKRVEEYGVKIEEVINTGGLSIKNATLMQIYADIIGKPMKVSQSEQTCALGAAIFGAVAAGAGTWQELQSKVTAIREKVYHPIPENVAVYRELYALYRDVHDAFGMAEWSGKLSHVMKQILDIRARLS